MPIKRNKRIKDHIHIMIRWKKIIDEMVFKCDDPDCEYTRTISFLIGKRSTCGVCKENTLILTVDDLKMVRPRCEKCSNRKEAAQTRELESVLEGFLTGEKK
jgi:hypothetical protein